MRHTSLTSEVCGYAEKQGTRVAAPGHGAQPGGMASRAAGPHPSLGYRRVSNLHNFEVFVAFRDVHHFERLFL